MTVISYGSSLEFPSFYTPHSGVNVSYCVLCITIFVFYQVEYCLESPRDCAGLISECMLV